MVAGRRILMGVIGRPHGVRGLVRVHSYAEGDLSALSQPAHLNTLARLRERSARILHGTDYPVVTSVLWSGLRGWLDRATVRQLQAERNPLERKVKLTRALGFPESVFREAWGVLRLAGRRAAAR